MSTKQKVRSEQLRKISVLILAICFLNIAWSWPFSKDRATGNAQRATEQQQPVADDEGKIVASPEAARDPEAKVSAETPPVTTIVSATRYAIPLEKSTRFATVITRDEIEKSGKVYLIDLLRGQPGVTVNQAGPAGRQTSIFMRGMNSDNTLVMLDGVLLNSPTSGAADLADLTLESIERIEILRGPQSVLYGSNAMGGVINIISKSGGKPGLHGTGQFEYGSHKTFYENGGISGAWKKFTFSGSGSRLDSRGPGENDGTQDTNAYGHGKMQVTENSELDVAFHHYNAIVGTEDGAFQQDPNASNRAYQEALNTDYKFSLLDGWQQSLNFNYFHDYLTGNDPVNPGTSEMAFPWDIFQMSSDRYTLGYQSDIHIKDYDVLSFGYQFEDTRSNNKAFDKIIHDHGWYAQNALTLWDIWTIVGGVHLDHNSMFGTEASPLVSTALWIEKTVTRLKGSFGKAYRTPTFNDLFYPDYGNPNLQPETSWGWDAGFEQYYLGKKGMFSADFFHNAVKNLIQSKPPLYVSENIGRATTQGVELGNKITLIKDLTFSSNYTYTDAVDNDTGKRLLRRPLHEGKMGLTYDWSKFHFSGDWIFVGMREDSTGVYGRPVRENNPGYTRLDLMISFDVTEHFQIYGRTQNTTDDHYDEVLGYDNPLATFYAGTKVKF